MIKNWNYLMRTVVYGAIVALVGYGGWRVQQAMVGRNQALAERDRRIAELGEELGKKNERIEAMAKELEEKNKQIQQLQLALQLLKVNHRLARIEVLDQRPSAGDPDKMQTTLRFVEIDAKDQPLSKPQQITILGTRAYVEYLVIKFEDHYVEQGDALRGTSICLFQRLFSEFQQPHEGFALDTVGSRPRAYSPGDEVSPLERQLWARFWDYANDPVKAQKAGVRAAHAEAPSMELRPGRVYYLQLRASDGLTFVPAPGGTK